MQGLNQRRLMSAGHRLIEAIGAHQFDGRVEELTELRTRQTR